MITEIENLSTVDEGPGEDEDSMDGSLEIRNVEWPSSTIMLVHDAMPQNILNLFSKYIEKKGDQLWQPSMTTDVNNDEEDDELGSDDEVIDEVHRKCYVAKDTSTLKRLFEKLDECVEDIVEEFLKKYPHFSIITTKEDFTLLKFTKGDFHADHIECTGLDDTSEGASRRLCVVTFLSSAPEDGGQFVFEYQGVTVPVQQGTVLVFPACPLHPNRVMQIESDDALVYTINYLL